MHQNHCNRPKENPIEVNVFRSKLQDISRKQKSILFCICIKTKWWGKRFAFFIRLLLATVVKHKTFLCAKCLLTFMVLQIHPLDFDRKTFALCKLCVRFVSLVRHSIYWSKTTRKSTKLTNYLLNMKVGYSFFDYFLCATEKNAETVQFTHILNIYMNRSVLLWAILLMAFDWQIFHDSIVIRAHNQEPNNNSFEWKEWEKNVPLHLTPFKWINFIAIDRIPSKCLNCCLSIDLLLHFVHFACARIINRWIV